MYIYILNIYYRLRIIMLLSFVMVSLLASCLDFLVVFPSFFQGKPIIVVLTKIGQRNHFSRSKKNKKKPT